MRSRLYGAAVVLQFTRSHSMQASVSMTGNPRIGARPRNFSRPSGELEPAFETLLANVTRLCQAKFGILHVREGDSFRMAAVHGAPPAYIAYRRHQPLIGLREFPHLPLARLARTKSVQHVADLTRERAYIERDPLMVALVESSGARSLLCIPMLKQEDVIGAIVIYYQEPRPLDQEQIALVKN